MNTESVNWVSTDGAHLIFSVLTEDEDWNGIGGIFAFGKIENEQWNILFIEEARSFKSEVPQHKEEWISAKNLGATNILAVRINQKSKRIKYKDELIQVFNPELNIH